MANPGRIPHPWMLLDSCFVIDYSKGQFAIMVTAGTMYRRLLWKEMRQLVPLGVGAIVIGILLLALSQATNVFASGSGLQYDPIVVLSVIPAMFAVGAGAVLVGQEKEQCTILWLSSLPVPKKTLIYCKWFATFAGWIAIWIVNLACVLICHLAGLLTWEVNQDVSWFDFLSVLSHSLFLTFSGLALAWKTRSSVAALVLLVPFAFIPYIIILLQQLVRQMVLGNASYKWTEARATTLQWSGLEIVCCIAVIYWGWRNAMHSLEASPQRRSETVINHRARHQTLPYTPLSALIWQFAKQNSQPLLVILCMFFLSVSLLLMPSVTSALTGIVRNEAAVTTYWAFIKASLAISGCGVLAFQGDRYFKGIRFLADRGISLRLIWLTRHAVPASIAGLGVALCLVVGRATIYFQSDSCRLFVYAFCLLAFLTYAISQWIGQVLSSAVLAIICAPLASLFFLGYAVFAVSMIGISPMLMFSLFVLPFFATFLTMRPWVDSRNGRNFWLMHALFLILILGLPWCPFVIALCSQPKLDTEIQHAFKKELASGSNSHRKVTTIAPSHLISSMPQPTRSDGNFFESRANIFLENIAANLDTGTMAMPQVGFALLFMREELAITYTKLGTLNASTSPDQDSPYSRERKHSSEFDRWSKRYSRFIEVATSLAESLRDEPFLLAQEHADQVEILILLHLQKSEGRDWIEAHVRQQACSLLVDESKRRNSRRSAIANEWKHLQVEHNESNQKTFIHVFLEKNRVQPNLIERLAIYGRYEQTLQTLWRLSDAKLNQVTAMRRELASLQELSPALYGLDQSDPLSQADDLESVFFTANLYRPAVGRLWSADWETKAHQLSQLE